MNLLARIDELSHLVLNGELGLDEALAAVEQWVDAHAAGLSDEAHQDFSAALDVESTNDNRSLVDSILKLHATRLLHRYELRHAPPTPAADEEDNDYVRARNRLSAVLQASEHSVNEARIDIAIANAHNLLGNVAANRRWLDQALDRLPDLAAHNLVAMAHDTPLMPPPHLNWLKRLGLRLIGLDFTRLAERNRDTLVTIAHMQTNQIVILAHLLGTSFEAIRERQRAKRAFRTAAHLIVRHQGMPYEDDSAQLADIAASLERSEPEAADLLHQQIAALQAVEDQAEDGTQH
jgi:tetratricopeptide (TPR) repeat protein